MASVNDRVNLQTSVVSIGSNVIQFRFKLVSWESFPIVLNNYRVVGYFNTYKNPSHLSIVCQNPGFPNGSTSGSLTTVNAAVSIDFFATSAVSPKIYPPTQRYDKEIIFPFTGTATILSSGSFFEGCIQQIQIAAASNFIGENGNSGYVTGQAAFSTSYTYTSAGSYTDNSTFILEFNDPTYGWIKVQEYSDGLTIDANTGKYPYDAVYEAKKAISVINRQYGYDTSYDHQRLVVSTDTYINQSLPSSNFSSATSFSLNGSANSDPASRIGLYKFNTSALASLIISGCEFYNYLGSSIQTVDVTCFLNTTDVTTSSTWNTNASGIYGAQEATMNTGNHQDFKDSYIAFQLAAADVQNWVTTSSTNMGMNLRYPYFTIDERYGDPTLYLTGNGTYYDPTLFVYGGPTSAVSHFKRWNGNTNTLWSQPSNWDGGIVPGSTDYAVFDQSYSTNPCHLDIDTTIMNLSAASGVYSGLLNLGASSLSINATSFSLGPYTNFVSSASTLDFKASLAGLYLSNGFSFNSLIFEQGANLSNYGSFNTNSLCLCAGQNLGQITGNSTINILSGGTIRLGVGSSITGPIILNMLPNAQITDTNGYLGAQWIYYYGSSIIRSRTYDCPVYLSTSNSTTYTSGIAQFTSGDCAFNNSFEISDSSGYIPTYYTIDMNTNSPTFVFNDGLNFNANQSKYINVNFPTGTISFSGDLTVSDSISSISNANNCTFNMIGNNTLTYYFNTSGSLLHLPNLYKNSGALTMNGETNYTSFYTVEIDNPASVILNTNALFSTTSLNISGPNTLYGLVGSIISGGTINLIGSPSIYMNATATSAWSANATTSLNASLVNLKNSIATGVEGYAIHSIDGGLNVNWFFDTIPPTITKVSATAQYSKTPITVTYLAYDSGAVNASNVGLTNSIGTLGNVVQVDSHNVKFDIILSGSNKAGYITVSAADQAGNYSQFVDGPYSYDNTAPAISVVGVSPPTSSSNLYIDVTVEAIDNCTFDQTNSANIFKATWNNNSISPISLIENTSADYTATYRLSSSVTLLNGILHISASDAASNTASFYSSALSINKESTTISFQSDPVSKVGYTYINVSAIFEDILGMTSAIPYQMLYNGQTFPFNTIYETPLKVLLSGSIPSSMGDGILSVSGYNSVGAFATSSDSGYKFVPTIIFGIPVPSNISKTTITVPISAIGSFTTDPNNYYCRLSLTQMPISQPVSASTVIQGFTFDYLNFSATVSALSDLRGDLILSAGYTGTLPTTTITILSITPTSGIISSATYINVNGTNFSSGAYVLFGETVASSINVVNSTNINCLTPIYSGTPISVNVSVINPDLTSATLINGFSYYNPNQFIDPRDGNVYNLITIGSQVWMTDNFRGLFGNVTTLANSATMGNLYTEADAVLYCPAGWHLPTSDDFNILVTTIGSNAGMHLKNSDASWNPNTGDNSSGWNGYAAGAYYPGSGYLNYGTNGLWWSSTTTSDGFYRLRLPANSSSAYVEDGGYLVNGLPVSLSIRYVKD